MRNPISEAERNQNVTTETESIAISIENMISNDCYISQKCCIFKIPNILFRHNEKAYTPNAFSIGPFHHGKSHLLATQKIKLQYLRGLLIQSQSPEFCLRYLIGQIKQLEPEARQCYAGNVNFTKQEFVKMLVLDGCFIIQLFRKNLKRGCQDDINDPVFSIPFMLQSLYHDLILLENQIPWFILDKLFQIISMPRETPLLNLTIIYFSNMFSPNPSSFSFTGYRNKHILDVLRNWLLSSSLKEEKNNIGSQQIPSVTALVEAGVVLKKGESKSILDIKFSGGVLEIPSLLIQETTEVIFRNLISFEQCYPLCRPVITSYAKFIDNLITTTKDVDYLCKKEIFYSWLSPDDATQFFSKLYLDTFLYEFLYQEVCAEVNTYSRRRWPQWRAAYMRNYFGTPWAIASQVAAVILLGCAMVQTLFTIFRRLNNQ